MTSRNRQLCLIFILLSSFLLQTNCKSKNEKNPSQQKSTTEDTEESTSDPSEYHLTQNGILHTVEDNQTLWDIARAYDISVKEIMKANDLRPSDVRRLKKGSQIHIPNASEVRQVETATDRAARLENLPTVKNGAYHFLRRGETIWTLARLYDIPIEAILKRNHLSDDDLGLLRIGHPVIVPGIRKSQVKQNDQENALGIVHQLIKGETIWDIAHAFQISVAEIMSANTLSEEEVRALREGTNIFIPGVEDDGKGRFRRKLSIYDRRALSRAQHLGLGSRRVAGQLLHGKVERRWIRAAGEVKPFRGTLRWPVAKGWFVRGYGSGEDGYHLAVDIMGKIGWNVRAAARGIVAYSGNELRGYGNTVIMVHPGGWVTMYAHNSMNFVKAGETVPRGAILAELGSTGISRGPHLHFEFIFNGKNCDPALLFRPGIRHRNNTTSKLDYQSWKQPHQKPKGIKCAPRRRHPRSRWVIHENPEEYQPK